MTTEALFSPVDQKVVLPTAVGYVHFNYDTASIARLSKLDGWVYFQNARYELASIDELPQDHVWLSNLDWLEHQALVGTKRPNIKSNRFLPMTLDQIRDELAISSDDEKFAHVLVTLGDHLLRLCQATYQGEFLRHLREQNTFAQAIGATIGMNKRSQAVIDDELHKQIIWDNLQEQTRLKTQDPSKPVICLRMPMYRHAAALMQCPLPSEDQPWQEVHVPASSLDEFFARDDLPSIVQVTDLKLPSQLEGIYPSQHSGRYSRKQQWMPNVEASFLRSIGHLEVGRVFIQKGGYRQSSPWNETVPKVTGALQLSYSAQMMCHAHFLSAATQLSNDYWPMHSWWIRSMDRMVMAFAVMPIEAIGLDLISYGEGCAFFQGTPMQIAKAIDMAPRLGLAPTQSAWRNADPLMSKEILNNPLWLPTELSNYEKSALQLSHREIGLTLRLDEAALMAISSEEMALEAITQIFRGIAHGKSY